MSIRDKFSDFDGYSSHRPLLYAALENTNGDVVEFGSGEGSTLLLNEYCEQQEREFTSFESNPEWFNKMVEKFPDLIFVKNWDHVILGTKRIGVLFIDHAPGERRKFDIDKYRSQADVIVVHDTEMSADYGYKMSTVLDSFKYRKDFRPERYAHTTAVSETIDISKWKL